MSHNFKKIAAASLAIVCAASMTGCADSGYIGTVNGIQIPNGLYLFYVAVNGYNDAKTQIQEERDSDSTAEITVFNNTIEGKTASAWLKDNAVEDLRRFAAVEDLFSQYGLSLTDEELTRISDIMNSLDDELYEKSNSDADQYYEEYFEKYYGLPKGFTSFGAYYESLCIGKSSLRMYWENSYKENHVFLHNYDTDGLTPVSDDEINTYLTENYAAVKFLKLSFTDYQGLELKDDAAIQEVKDLAQAYADRYNSTGDWSEIRYDFDLRQAQFDAWTQADDDYAKQKSEEAAAGTAEAEPEAQNEPAPTTAEAATAENAATAEAPADETASTAEAASTAESTAEAADGEVEASSDTIFVKPVVNTDDADYNKFAQDAIDAATAEKKDADSLETYIKKDSSTLDEKLTEYIWNAQADSKATLFTDENSNCIYVVVRDDVTTMESWKTTQHENFLHALRDDAFEELLKNTYANYVVDLDDYLVNTKYAPEKLRGIGE